MEVYIKCKSDVSHVFRTNLLVSCIMLHSYYRTTYLNCDITIISVVQYLDND